MIHAICIVIEHSSRIDKMRRAFEKQFKMVKSFTNNILILVTKIDNERGDPNVYFTNVKNEFDKYEKDKFKNIIFFSNENIFSYDLANFIYNTASNMPLIINNDS